MIFRFRQFSITQKVSAMKVGTDSVLLGSFCDPVKAKIILDIGAGTGLLTLMLAQKSMAHIDAVEPDLAAYSECVLNFEQSSWSDRLNIFHGKIQDFKSTKKYDLIISNPPYYQKLHNISIPNKQRSLARHDQELSLEILCREMVQRLNHDGECWLILPVREAITFVDFAKANGLWLKSKINVKPNPKKEINRCILCFTFNECISRESFIQLYDQKGSVSKEYVKKTKDYLLWSTFTEEELNRL
ncbi:MAG: methyltransferase [Bacteroidia bacterium]|jgi:tRNA1Val (adenine37-N6)-methyltransferase